MNKEVLQRAEALFLQKYPAGFMQPELEALGKKHKMPQMIAFAQESFAPLMFARHTEIAEAMIKVISRSSMVSMFEKPKFRDFVRSLDSRETEALAAALRAQLHGEQQHGFEAMVSILKPAKLAKWSLVTIIPNYYYPDAEVFVKPTTAKGVIKHFELAALDYKPEPTWEFYQGYREAILAMKAQVIDTLSPNNAAFCGFLMMSLSESHG